MRVLAIGAHFDDVELGCGGALARLGREGHELFLFVATRSGYADPRGNPVRTDEQARAEGEKAAALLGASLLTAEFPTFGLEFSEPLNQAVLKALDQSKPDLLFTHWAGDTHLDHRALALSSLHCTRRISRVLAYRSNWYDGEGTFDPRFFVDITGTLEAKLGLVEAHASECARTMGAWRDFVLSQARLCGLKAGVAQAEGFEVVKWTL